MVQSTGFLTEKCLHVTYMNTTNTVPMLKKDGTTVNALPMLNKARPDHLCFYLIDDKNDDDVKMSNGVVTKTPSGTYISNLIGTIGSQGSSFFDGWKTNVFQNISQEQFKVHQSSRITKATFISFQLSNVGLMPQQEDEYILKKH